jgi:hypothetical protein
VFATSCLCFAAFRQKQSLRVHGACDHYQCSPERAPINYITITKSCAIILQFNPPSCSLCHKVPKYGCSHTSLNYLFIVSAAPAALISHQTKPHKLRSDQKCHHQCGVREFYRPDNTLTARVANGKREFFISVLDFFELTKNCAV